MSEKTGGSWLFSPAQLALLGLLAGALFLAFKIIRPFLDPILIAAILAPVVHPLYRWLRARFRGRASLAALATCVLVVVVILGPLSLLAVGIVGEGTSSVKAIQGWVQEGGIDQLMTGPRVEKVRAFVARVAPLVDPERLELKNLVLSLSTKAGNLVAGQAKALLTGTGLLLSKVVLMLFVLYFAVRDGEEMLAGIRSLSPLPPEQEDRLLARFRSQSRSSLLGILGTAAAQGTVGGIGLALVGLPGLFWGTVMAFTSLIPFVGTALVWVPAAVYLLITGHPVMATFLALWCVVIVGTIDNFLRPVLMRGESGMSTLWMFFAVLGGLQYFGLPGLLYGPLVFGLCAVLLFMYRTEFAHVLNRPGAA